MSSPQEFFGYQSYLNLNLPQFPFNTYSNYNINWPWYSYQQVTAQIEYYTNLLIMQYHNKPKAEATIAALVEPIIMNLLPQQVMNGYEIGTAVGTQLDVLGKYVGVSRTGVGPNGQITLNDSDFTKFIQLAIVNNHNNGTLAATQALLNLFFENEIFVFDHSNLLSARISYFIASDSIDINLATLFVTEGKLPKPLGVQLASVIYAPLDDLEEFFGCRTYELPAFHVSPLNNYDTYNMDYPMLTYADILVIQ